MDRSRAGWWPPRFSIRTMLVLVALVAVALACVIWPRKRGVWESSAPGVANRFVIEFKRSPFHLVAVATPVGLGGQYADRIVFWFDGESIQHANLVENEEVVELPIRVYGDWPLKLYVVTYGERAVIESLTVDADGRVGNVHGIELLQPDDPRLAGKVKKMGIQLPVQSSRLLPLALTTTGSGGVESIRCEQTARYHQRVEDFSTGMLSELDQLHEQLRGDLYRPAAVRRTWIPKPGSHLDQWSLIEKSLSACNTCPLVRIVVHKTVRPS